MENALQQQAKNMAAREVTIAFLEDLRKTFKEAPWNPEDCHEGSIASNYPGVTLYRMHVEADEAIDKLIDFVRAFAPGEWND